MSGRDREYLWGVRRYDVDPDGSGVIMRPEDNTEKSAREWYASFMESFRHYVKNHPEEKTIMPELVRAKLNWEIVE